MNLRKIRTVLVLAVGMSCGVGQVQAATIVGDTVDATSFAGSGSALVIDPGVEFTFTAGNGEVDKIDLFATSIFFSVAAPSGMSNWSFFGASGGDQFVVSDIDAFAGDIITGVAFSSPAMSNGVTASSLTFFDSPAPGDGFVSFEISGSMSDVTAPSSWTVDLTLTPVPEPDALALLGLGLAGMGWSRRKAA